MIARRVEEIQPLSAVAIRLVQLMGNEKRDVRELIHIISLDAALTLRVVRVANSAAFARRERVTSMPQAVSLLGEQLVVGIAVGSSSPAVFQDELSGYEAEAGALWAHSLRTALAAREIARKCKSPISFDEAFTAGILHDIGKAVIDDFLAERSNEIELDLKTLSKVDFSVLEREKLGTDHCEVGDSLARKWNIPANLCSAIRFHHYPACAPEQDRPMVFAVHLGDILAMSLGDGTGVDTLAYGLDEGYTVYYDLSHSHIESILALVRSEFADAKSLISY